MKILLYVDPWIDIADSPEFKCNWLKQFISRSIRNLYAHAKIIKEENIEIQILCSDIVENYLNQEDYEWIKFNIISQQEIKHLFKSFDEYISIQKKENNKKENFFDLNCLISSKLDNYNPDIILLNCSFARNLEYLFPDSLILFYENGIFTRSPYPQALYFDFCSNMDNSFLVKNKNNILNYKVDGKSIKFVQDIRNFFQGPLKKYNPFRSDITICKNSGYKYLILFALEHFDSTLFKTSNNYKDQLEYIDYIFQNIDSDIGVIVTEHSLYKFVQHEPIVNHFKKKYENFFYIPKTSKYNNSSQFLLQYVDGVITNSSTLGLQSVLHKKPLFIPNKNSYLNIFSDESDLKKIKEYFDNKKYQNKDNSLYWLLTRYYVLSDYFENGEWFYNFIKKSLSKTENKSNISFYDPIDTDEELISKICNQETVNIFIQSMACKTISRKKNKSFLSKLKRSIKKRLKLVS